MSANTHSPHQHLHRDSNPANEATEPLVNAMGEGDGKEDGVGGHGAAMRGPALTEWIAASSVSTSAVGSESGRRHTELA